MKKRLLITSIVMMLVVAVALSTATYAWFTSNARVDAASITLKADTSDATALGIGWAGGAASTSISANVSGVLKPMAPVALTDGTTTAGSGASDIVFKTQTTKNENSVYVFNGAGESATPVTFGNGTATAFYIKNLSNANKIDSITISAVFGADSPLTGDAYTYAFTGDTTFADGKTYYTKSGDAFIAASVTVGGSVTADTYYEQTVTSAASLTGNDMVRVAIFRKSATTSDSYKTYTDGDYKLIGVLGSANTAYTEATSLTEFDKNTTYYTRTGSGTTESPYVYAQVAANTPYDGGTTYYTAANTAVYGTIAADGAVKDLSNHKVSTTLELITDGSLNKLAQVDLMAIVWLDGSKFDDTRAGEIASVSLKFTA